MKKLLAAAFTTFLVVLLTGIGGAAIAGS